MFKILYPQKDATIYEMVPERNTGIDQILELTKRAQGSRGPDQSDPFFAWQETFNSRILIKFDLSEISNQITSKQITGRKKFYLVLTSCDSQALPTEYTIHAIPCSGSWINGNGAYYDKPQQNNGVSWTYRSSKSSGIKWMTSSYVAGSTGSYISNPGGGTWYNTPIASQSFALENPDIRMDVTAIVDKWLSGSIANDGFIIKFSPYDELSTNILGSIKFFGRETHTIYVPRLEMQYSNETFNATASFNQINTSNYVVYIKNMQEWYKEDQLAKLILGVRPRFPIKTYSTSSNYLKSWRLPTSSYYSVMDVSSGEIIIPYSTLGSKIGCDSEGNYIMLDMNTFSPERYYKIMIQVRDGNNQRIIDDGYYFKVVR